MATIFDKLSEEEKKIVIMYWKEGASLKELADYLHMSVGTTKNKLHRLKVKIQGMIVKNFLLVTLLTLCILRAFMNEGGRLNEWKKAFSKGGNHQKIWSSEHTLGLDEIREIMDTEMSKPLNEIDHALVDKCSQLLCEQFGCTQAANASEAMIADSKRNLRVRIADQNERLNASTVTNCRWIFRAITVTAICVVVTGLIGIWTPPGTLQMQPSDDSEDYMTYGQTPAVQQNANADRITSDDIYTTNSLADAFAHLGYEIDMPTSFPEGTSLSEVDVMQNEVSDSLQRVYRIDDRLALRLDVDVIRDYSGVTIAREQNQNGETRTLLSGKEVYAAQNLEQNWVLYTAGRTIYQATSSHYDVDALLKIIDSIGEEWPVHHINVKHKKE